MIDWMIHVVSGKELVPGMVDAHTHGLDKYDSFELQFVLAYPNEYIGSILNELGEQIASGEKINDGDLVRVSGVMCDMQVFETTDSFGDPVLRVIMPDGKMRWPEDSDEYPYNLQKTSPYFSVSPV